MSPIAIKNIIQIRLVELHYQTCRNTDEFNYHFLTYVKNKDHRKLRNIIESNYDRFKESAHIEEELDILIIEFDYFE